MKRVPGIGLMLAPRTGCCTTEAFKREKNRPLALNVFFEEKKCALSIRTSWEVLLRATRALAVEFETAGT